MAPTNLLRSQLKLQSLLDTAGNIGYYHGKLTFTEGKNKGRSVNVDVKLLRDCDNAKTETKVLLNEASKLAELSHPAVMGLYGTVDHPIMIVLETSHFSSVDTLFPLELGLIRKFIVDVLEGLTYLNRSKIIHGDIACRNVYLSRGKGKISNFGQEYFSASNSSPVGYYTSAGGKILRRWAAPEAVDNITIQTAAIDVWGFGTFAYELLSEGKIPYGEDVWVTEEIYLQTMFEVHAGCVLPQPEGSPNDVYDILVRCWDTNPEDRPNIETVLSELTSQAAVDELDELLANLPTFDSPEKGAKSPQAHSPHTKSLLDKNETLFAELESLRADLAEKNNSPKKESRSSPERQGLYHPGFGSRVTPRSKTPIVNSQALERFKQVFN